jgi:hypothetical protein
MAAVCGEATVLSALLDGRVRGEHIRGYVDGGSRGWVRRVGECHHFHQTDSHLRCVCGLLSMSTDELAHRTSTLYNL